MAVFVVLNMTWNAESSLNHEHTSAEIMKIFENFEVRYKLYSLSSICWVNLLKRLKTAANTNDMNKTCEIRELFIEFIWISSKRKCQCTIFTAYGLLPMWKRCVTFTLRCFLQRNISFWFNGLRDTLAT